MAFKKGDRVAVYSGAAKPENCHRQIGVVERVTDGGMVLVVFDTGMEWWCNPKQCRRLKKRERRRIWVQCKDSGMSTLAGRLQNYVEILREPESDDYVEFREVIRKK